MHTHVHLVLYIHVHTHNNTSQILDAYSVGHKHETARMPQAYSYYFRIEISS